MAEVSIWGATYHNVPAVQLPQTGGGLVIFWEGVDGNNLGYGITDGSIPKVGIAKAGLAHAWDDLLPMMIFGEGEIGVGRVV